MREYLTKMFGEVTDEQLEIFKEAFTHRTVDAKRNNKKWILLGKTALETCNNAYILNRLKDYTYNEVTTVLDIVTSTAASIEFMKRLSVCKFIIADGDYSPLEPLHGFIGAVCWIYGIQCVDWLLSPHYDAILSSEEVIENAYEFTSLLHNKLNSLPLQWDYVSIPLEKNKHTVQLVINNQIVMSVTGNSKKECKREIGHRAFICRVWEDFLCHI